ncbi:MAG: CoA pyrophosphatase [Magnetococcales bacterium]|nr:CoA pyrophosphatase [Magnetococcales bacterium]
MTPEFITSSLDEKSGPTWQTILQAEEASAWRQAAVIVPLIARGSEWDLLFIRRTLTVSHHKGQIAFPGGRAEPHDASPLATALREFQEELGADPALLAILGRLPPTPTLQSGYLIHPFVGVLPHGTVLRPSPDEVAETLLVPLNFFLETLKLSPKIERFEYRGEVIWGATARVMTQWSVALLTRSACAS